MELKTCPSCGNEHIWIEDIEARGAVEFYAVCPSCGMKGGNRKTPEKAAEAWNMRAERTCKQVLVECNDGLIPPLRAYCSACDAEWGYTPNYCPNCGRRVVS